MKRKLDDSSDSSRPRKRFKRSRRKRELSDPAETKAYDPEKPYYCYLIVDDKKRTYIGCTNNPPRRLRQHNGEIQGGAKRTKRMLGTAKFAFYIRGFLGHKDALRFEYRWNKGGARTLKARLVKALTMLSMDRWTRAAVPIAERPAGWSMVCTWFLNPKNLLNIDVTKYPSILPVSHEYVGEA